MAQAKAGKVLTKRSAQRAKIADLQNLFFIIRTKIGSVMGAYGVSKGQKIFFPGCRRRLKLIYADKIIRDGLARAGKLF